MMKKIRLVILLQLIGFAAFGQNPRWTEFGTHIPALTNLDIHWNTPTNFGVGYNMPTNAWHATLGIYQLLPRRFPAQTISNLTAMLAFSEADKAKEAGEEMVYKKNGRRLTISFADGSIEYEIPEPHYSPTNLAQGVPGKEQMPGLITNFFKAVGIPLAEIMADTNGAPAFNFAQDVTFFFVGKETITNIPFGAVVLNRAVEEAQVIAEPGHCRLEFGEQGAIIQIKLSWPLLQQVKSGRVLTPSAAMQAFRQGKAIQGFIPSNIGEINWLSIKSVTINQAWPCYFAGTQSVMYPFLDLWASVETGFGRADIEIDCPIIDESELQKMGRRPGPKF